MNIYRFCYRTAFTKEVKYYQAEVFEEALNQYNNDVAKRNSVQCYLDYVWKCNDNGEPVTRIFERS